MAPSKLKVNDRVKRVNLQGCLGVVRELRTEVTLTSGSQEGKEKPLMVHVLWDNGTMSYLTPDALEVVRNG